MKALCFVVVCSVLFLSACGDDAVSVDAGDSDVLGMPDASSEDGGTGEDVGRDASSGVDAEPPVDSGPTPDGGPTPDLLFASDWSSATGGADNAISDGSLWPDFRCSPDQGRNDVLEVVPGADLGFDRTENVLCFQHLGDADNNPCGMIFIRNILPASTTFWGRHYFRNDETLNVSNHPLTLHDADFQAVLWARVGTAAGVEVKFAATRPGEAYDPLETWFAGDPSEPGPPSYGRVALSHGEWFRYEYQIEFLTPTTIRVHPRIYDASGTLLYDDDDFVQNDYGDIGQDQTLANYYAEGNSFIVRDPELARTLALAQEGPFGNRPNPDEAWYVADLALSLEGWIGE